jgi:hypothetical protein
MDQAADSLTTELASNIVRHEVHLTEDQKALGIPPALVYVAGLLLCSKSSTSIAPPFSAELQERFLELQQLYYNGLTTGTNECNENGRKTFHLSPRLVPSSDQLALIKKDFVAKIKELEMQADAMAKELIIDQEEKDKTNHIRMDKSSKKKTVPVPKQRSTNENQSQTTPLKQPETKIAPEETLQDLMNMQIRTEAFHATCEDGGSWVTIKKKGNKFDLRSQNYVTEGNNNVGETNAEEEPIVTSNTQLDDFVDKCARRNDRNLAVERVHDISKPELEEMSDRIQPTSITSIPITCSDDTNTRNHPDTLLQERIQYLEMKLIQKNKQLVEERKIHFKSKRELKEGFEDQIQALQMRLYISETRLKNYQDALEQHIQTVANNVPGT